MLLLKNVTLAHWPVCMSLLTGVVQSVTMRQTGGTAIRTAPLQYPLGSSPAGSARCAMRFGYGRLPP